MKKDLIKDRQSDQLQNGFVYLALQYDEFLTTGCAVSSYYNLNSLVRLLLFSINY